MSVTELFRPFQASHPWITFRFDMGQLTWLDNFRFGEAHSKIQHLAGAPLKPRVLEELHTVYLVKGALATTAIEGNTMTEQQARDRVEGKNSLPPSREYQGVALDNITAIYSDLINQTATSNPPDLTVDLICDFNRRVLEGQPLEPGIEPGQFRTQSVGVGTYRGAPAEDCEYLVRQLTEWLNRDWLYDPSSPMQQQTPEQQFIVLTLKAILAHLYLAWIHPFGDGNGRTARLVEYLLLLKHGVPTPACHLMSNHYNLTRDRYYAELRRASSLSPDLGAAKFVGYALEGFVDGLRNQIDEVRKQQLDIIWADFVHERFRQHGSTRTQERRLQLVLTMSAEESVRRRDVPDLSPQLARAYAGKQEKTISRDLNALIADDLVRRVPGGYVTNKRIVEGFMPLTAAEVAASRDIATDH